MITPEILHYFAAISSISLAAIGAGIGLSIAGLGAQTAMTRQPMGSLGYFRTLMIGLALIESGAIIALVTTIITLSGGLEGLTFETGLVELGAGLAVGVAAAATSIASSFVVRASTESLARQPLFLPKIMTFMLIAQSIIEAPVIFAFISALIMRANIHPNITYFHALKLLAAGIAVAIGCIGPSIGQALFSRAACTSIGINKNAYNRLFIFSLINQAMIETPMIFCVLMAMIMINSPAALEITSAVKALVAAITIGLGAFGGSVGMGYVASKSCQQIALDQESYSLILRSNLLVLFFIESITIYALIIAIRLVT